ncbi:class B sortase [Salipaludibacillus sp. HK11]|uniref:class B sortase n=1 Tax=Salipaludibacillus sp. HK11 TaxID=3394320 RepID=UPI0039FD795F
MDKKRLNTSKKKSFFHRMVTLLILSVILFSTYKVVDIFYGYYTNREVLAEAQSIYDSSVPDEIVTHDKKQIRSQFEELLQINQDIVGWITIDNTNVDYPVLQAKDNDYYLFRNYKKEETRAGSLFMDFRNDSSEIPRNTIVYGHNMRDGSMFGQLDKFLDEEFFLANQTFYYDTLYEKYDVEIISVYLSTTDFYYIETDFDTDDDYLHFLQEIQQKSQFDTERNLTAEDNILTLSTCDSTLDSEEGRLVVHARIVER